MVVRYDMNKLHFQIITPDKVAFSDEINQLTLPTIEGEITILPNHIPLVTAIKPGTITIKKENETHHMAVMGGFLEISDNKIRLMAEAAELAEEIDERRAEEARQRAQKAVSEAKDQVEFADATAALERSISRIKVAQRKSRHHSTSM